MKLALKFLLQNFDKFDEIKHLLCMTNTKALQAVNMAHGDQC